MSRLDILTITMAKPAIFVSATIVAIFLGLNVEASPTTELKQLEPAESQGEVKALDDNMAVSEAPTIKAKPEPTDSRYYPYQQALTFRSGYESDFPKLGVEDWALGFQYMFPKFLSPKLEAGADLHKEGRGHLHVGVRWIYFEKTYFRPSWKLAFDHHIDSKDGIAALAEFKNYYVRGGGTLEYVAWNPYSIRLDNEVLVNFDKFRWLIFLGISRGW